MTASDMMQCAITDECTVYYDQELRLSQRIPHHPNFEDITIFDSEGEHTVPCDDLFEEDIAHSCTLTDGSVLVRFVD